MKKILLILALLPLLAFDSGEKYLGKIEWYQKDSYYKQKVYAQHDWKSFYRLKEAQANIELFDIDEHLLSAAVFFATNKMRESKHVKPLQFSHQLRDAAVVHTNQMIEKGFFDHFNKFTPDLRSPDQRIKLFGIASTALAENIDRTGSRIDGKTTYLQLAEQIVQDFYDSPPHRKNMLGKEFTHLGCVAVFEQLGHQQWTHYVKVTQDYSGDY